MLMVRREMLIVHRISCQGGGILSSVPVLSASGSGCCAVPSSIVSGCCELEVSDSDFGRLLSEIPDKRIRSLYAGYLSSEKQLDLLIDLAGRGGIPVYAVPQMPESEYGNHTFVSKAADLCRKAELAVFDRITFRIISGNVPTDAESVAEVFRRSGLCGSNPVLIIPDEDRRAIRMYYSDRTIGIQSERVCFENGCPDDAADAAGFLIAGALDSYVPFEKAVKIASDLLPDYYSGDSGFILRYLSAIESGSMFRTAVSDKDIKSSASLAGTIWPEAYAGIITGEQIDYMVSMFQSEKAIRDQISGGYTYVILSENGSDKGYGSYRPDGDSLFVSKIYVSRDCRGKGYGKKLIEYMTEAGKALGMSSLYLTVNRNNANAISFYEAAGFRKAGTRVADIGGGFVMDDYVMELSL